MKIKELELKEIERHAHIHWNFGDASTIGLIGPNASGKSTILSSLGFLLTGTWTSAETPDAQETMVRFWGKEGGASNGTLRCVFTQHGQEGEIFRQIGKTPKRWLKWGGETYTKAADVDRVMNEILGSDRRALQESVFIPQGVLEKIFFGTQSEREEIK